MKHKVVQTRHSHDQEIIAYGVAALVVIAALLVAGPASLMIGLAGGVFFGLLANRLIALGPLVVGGVLSILPASRFFDGFWSARVELFKAEIFAGNFERFFFHNMLALENIALGLIVAGVVGTGLAIYENSPARRAYRNGRAGAQGGIKPGWWARRSATRRGNKGVLSKGATVLGVDLPRGKPLTVSDKDLNTHMLVAGTTGSGKTVTVGNLIESFIARGLPVVFIDGKGDQDLARQVLNFATAAARPSWLFTMQDVTSSCKYNPLASGGFSSKRDRIIELREWSEPHYKKLAEGYLQTVFKVLEATKTPADLISATEFLDRSKLTAILRDAVKKKTLTKEQGKKLADEVSDQENAEEHIEGLRAELRNLANSELGPLFDTSETFTAVVDDSDGDTSLPAPVPPLTLSEVLRVGGVAYFSLYPFAFPNLSDIFGKLIVNDLKASFDPNTRQEMLCVIDEFTTLAGPQVLNLLNQGRSRGAHVVLTVQGLADLGQKINKNALLFSEQIISNCNTYAIHRMNSAMDAEKLADIIGKKWSMDISAQVGAVGATGAGHARRVREHIADPDEIQKLGTGCALFLNKNNGRFTRFLARKGWLF